MTLANYMNDTINNFKLKFNGGGGQSKKILNITGLQYHVINIILTEIIFQKYIDHAMNEFKSSLFRSDDDKILHTLFKV